MMPNDSVAVIGVPGVLLAPDDRAAEQLEDFEAGGIALQDTSQGLMSYVWRVWVSAGKVWLQREGGGSLIELFNDPGVAEIALAFDQNMRPNVAYRDGAGQLYLRWYDSVAELYVTSSFGAGRNPKLTLDDKRPTQSTSSDVIFAYIKGTGALCARQQRERFTVERICKTSVPASIKLARFGMARNLRLQFELV